LLVDDEPRLLFALCAALEDDELELVTAATLGQAIEAASAGDFDAIVCDLELGAETGLALHAHLMRERPRLSGRMILMTGRLDAPPDVPRLLPKPFTAADLRAALAEVFAANG
jgi:DNA-binding NtrC family response regulator